MAWARIDDRFPSHRKIALLSDRAFRLHVSAICWCAENLTDGHVGDRELALVANVRGIKATAKQLEDAGLWDRVDGGWVVHDYLDYNPSRDQVLAERKKNAERQERFRQRKNGKPTPPSNGSSNGRSNGVTHGAKTQPDDTTATRPQHDGDTTATRSGAVQDEDSQVSSICNGVTNDAPSRPGPSVTTDVVTAASWAARKNGVPDELKPLAQALAAAELGAVAWDIKKFTDWQRIRTQVERLGIDLMVRSARTAADNRGEPDSVTAWIGRWESLEPEPEQPAGRPRLRAVAGGWTGPNRPHPSTGAAAPTPTADEYKNARPF
ncbi:hypothetical protein OOK27_05185 [Streptomyces canus]|uniref:hypothetical protein n=1 Tax=Streptomyces canus TaxID=58343 RepID=UPI00225B0D3A|nr:hypothetical protein [Streptomyces canus]MCX5253566.1 hypothetical protein [Streptomyces canus]